MDTIAELKNLQYKLIQYDGRDCFTAEEIDHLLLLVEEDILQNA